MPQANDSFVSLPDGSGTNLATHLVNGKEHQVVMMADESGHLVQSLPSYTFYIKAQAGGANKVHFDLFNASGSGSVIEIRGLWVMPSIISVVTGTLSPDFDAFRTSAVGTGGATIGYKSTTFPNISPMDTNNANLPAQITMRAAPTGGATTAEALFTSYVTQEETQAGAQLGQWFNALPITTMGQRVTLQVNQGFKLTQVTAGAAQNFSFFGLYTVVS